MPVTSQPRPDYSPDHRCAPPELSIVVPTRNEGANVGELSIQLHETLRARALSYEILFVDDSTDDTPERIGALASQLPVRLYHRAPGERTGGLGSAVLDGFARADGDVIVVMDGDLQHPPELVPVLVDAVRSGSADVAIGSRFVPGGSAQGLNGPLRRYASHAARFAARLAVRRARHLHDPLSGFFAIRRDVLGAGPSSSEGFKILLDVLAVGAWRQAVEVPVVLAPRGRGASKASGSVGMQFLSQLWRLRRSPRERGVSVHAGPRLATSSAGGPQ